MRQSTVGRCDIDPQTFYTARFTHISSDSSGFIEAQSIVKLQKSTRRISREPLYVPNVMEI
ncbi:MAG: hypothetical protein LBF66_02040, partial [Holosporales bacterium]|nr:hypothetical protein [Holosporales bacterium]